jgi:amidophosphoribosyltransferase
MGEFIGHECGLAMVRLRQPLTYFRQRYGDAAWGLRRLFLLMQKQHNRGQDGAGIALSKFNMPPGEAYLRRVRTDRQNAIERLFSVAMRDVNRMMRRPNRRQHDLTDEQIKVRCDFVGEVMMGHLRYATSSGTTLSNCHPLIRKNNVASRNLALAGNFNMTNAPRLFERLMEYGLNPVGESDTQVILERIGYELDQEHRHLRVTMGPDSLHGLDGRELAEAVSDEINITRILSKAAEDWDGGYAIGGIVGNGDMFVCRDPAGIRPGYFLITEELVAMASERAALANVFDVDIDTIEAVAPGHVLVVKRDGHITHEPFLAPLELRQCTFERVYFSRGNDPAIYLQRKALGYNLAPRVLDKLDDIDDAVFSFIPNTAESAYLGLLEEVERRVRDIRATRLTERMQRGDASEDDVHRLLRWRVRAEKIAHKDQRLRTFITADDARRDLVAHIYDITRGIVKPTDTLVVIDDSIVRGTTLRESIITILSRLNPARILVLSSAPPIMYPDCYGIDMSQLGRFIAFEAAVALLHDTHHLHVLDEVEDLCLRQADDAPAVMRNHVAKIYDCFTQEQIEAKVAQLVRPKNIAWNGELQVMYQTVQGLHKAMPGYTGDWYFTGRYPTPGGYEVLNRSYLNWRRHEDDRRAY